MLTYPGSGGNTGDPLALGLGATKTITLTNGGTIEPTSNSNPTNAASGDEKEFVIGSGGGTFNVPNGVTFQLDDAGQFSGSGNLTIVGAGSGTVSFNNQAYPFTGNIFVNSATLRVNTNAQDLGTGTGQTVTVASGAVFDVQTTGIPQAVVLNGTGIGGAGALINSNANGTNNNASLTATVTLGSNSSVGGNSTGTLTLSGLLTDNSGGFSLTKVGSNTIALAHSSNTYSGGTFITGGTLSGTAAGAFGTGNVTVNGGTLTETANAFSGGSQALIVSSGTANLSVLNSYTGGTQLSGTGTINASAAGAVPGTVAMSGGTLNASAAGSLGGNITMTGGTLSASSATSALGANSVTLNGGLITSSLGSATGVLGGTVNGSASAATINPGGVGTVGTLSIGTLNLTAGTGTTLQFDENLPWSGTAANTGDLLIVSYSGGFTAASGTPIAFTNGAPTNAGDYRLIQYFGTAPTLTNFTLPSSPRSGIIYNLTTTDDPGFIDLQVANTASPVTANWQPTAAGTYSWQNTGPGTAPNGGWGTLGSTVPGIAGDTANVTAATSGAETIQLNGQPHVGTLVFTPGAGGSYTIAQNATTDTLSLDNGTSAAQVTNHLGRTTISAPVYLISSNSNFSVASGTTLTFSGVVGGAGGITLASSAPSGGTLLLSGNNTFTGGLTINAGVVSVSTTTLNPLGGVTTGTGNVAIAGGATLNLSNGTATINTAAGQVFTFGTGGGTIYTGGNGTTGKLFIGNAGTLAGSGQFTKSGGADLQINSANAGFSGNVNIVGGLIEVQNSAALGGTPGVAGSGGIITIAGVGATTSTAGSSATTTGSELAQVTSTTGLLTGQVVTGTGITGTVYVTSIVDPTHVILSAPATGTGNNALTFAAQNGELVGSTVTLPNNLVITGTGVISANNPSTFLGSLTVPTSGTFTLAPRAFQTTTAGEPMIFTGAITGGASLVISAPLLTSQGTVILEGNDSGWTGNSAITLGNFQTLQFDSVDSGAGQYNSRPNSTGVPVIFNGTNTPTLGLATDGDGTGAPNVAATYTDTLTFTTSGVINVGRAALGLPVGSQLYMTAANKLIVESNALSIGSVSLTVNNNNGYGLQFTNAVTLSGTPTFSVTNATFSNQTQGLTVSGQITGVGFTKTGAGALVLANSANNFTGTIAVTQGVLSVGSDAALGNTANGINLNGGANVSTFRATGTFGLAPTRTLTLSSTTAGDNAIEVTPGNTLTVNSAFGLGAVTNALTKSGNGTLVINANNPTWTGGITVNAGAVMVNTSTLTTPLGSGGTVTINNQGSAVQLSGGVTITGTTLVNNFSSNVNGGINSGGAIESVSGNNTWSGVITQTSGDAVTYGADTGATLNLSPSTYNDTGANSMGLQGGGNVNIQFVLPNVNTLNQWGTGTTTLSTASTAFTNPLNVDAGTFAISGTGAAIGITGLVTVQPGASLNVVDTGTALPSRLGGRPVTLNGATYAYTINGTATSSETEGVLTIGAGGSTVSVSQPSGTQSDTITFASLTQATAGSSLNFSGVLGTSTNKILITANPAVTNGLISVRDVVTGASSFDFATYSANGVAAFSAYNTGNNLNTALATDTVKLTASSGLNASATIYALAFNGTGLAANGAAQTLTLTSGGLLVTGGSDTLNVSLVALGATEGIFHVASGSTATMNGTFTGTAGLTKADAGSLVLASPQFYTGTTTINGGILQLASGGTNTLFFNNALAVNAGGTLDLNGGVQYVASLTSASATINSGIAGGTITSSTNTGTLVTSPSGGANFAGSITGTSVGFAKSATNTLTLLGSSTYGGPTLLNGGLTILADSGAISSAATLTINDATLQLDNSRLSDLSTRLNSAAPITLNGGAIQYNGRIATLSTETLGAVTLASGVSLISAANGSNTTANNYEGATLVLTSLTRSGDSIVDFGQQYQTTSGNTAVGALGLIGNGTGQSENILVTGGIPLTNNIIGGWAVVSAYASTNSSNSAFFDFASYAPGIGVGMLSTAGFAGNDATALPAVTGTAASAQNIKLTGTATLATGGATTINSLNLVSGAASTLTFAAPTDMLNLNSGGFIVSGNNANLIGGSANSGRLTRRGTANSGTSDLYMYDFQNTLALNSEVVDNPNGAKVQLIINGLGNVAGFGGNTVTLAGTNSYSGGTIVNDGETVTVATTGFLPAGGTGLDHQQRHRDHRGRPGRKRGNRPSGRHPQRRLGADSRRYEHAHQPHLQQQRRHRHAHRGRRHVADDQRRYDHRLFQQRGHHQHPQRHRGQPRQRRWHNLGQPDHLQLAKPSPLAGHVEHLGPAHRDHQPERQRRRPARAERGQHDRRQYLSRRRHWSVPGQRHRAGQRHGQLVARRGRLFPLHRQLHGRQSDHVGRRPGHRRRKQPHLQQHGGPESFGQHQSDRGSPRRHGHLQQCAQRQRLEPHQARFRHVGALQQQYVHRRRHAQQRHFAGQRPGRRHAQSARLRHTHDQRRRGPVSQQRRGQQDRDRLREQCQPE